MIEVLAAPQPPAKAVFQRLCGVVDQACQQHCARSAVLAAQAQGLSGGRLPDAGAEQYAYTDADGNRVRLQLHPMDRPGGAGLLTQLILTLTPADGLTRTHLRQCEDQPTA